MRNRIIEIRDTLVRLRISRALGLMLFLVGVLTYRSVQNHEVLGRWSYPYAGIIAGAVLLVGFAIGSSLRRYLGRLSQIVPTSSAYADMALLLWGAGYLISSLDDRPNGGRIADLNVFGSITPAAALLEWLALALLVYAVAIILWKNREQNWVNIGLVLWSLAVVLVLSEGAIRMGRCWQPIVQGFPTYSNALWSRTHVRLNQAGFRDAEHQISRDTSHHRLLIVGDSYAFGWGLDRVEHRFGEHLAMKLEERTGVKWEPINASRPDTHTLDHIAFLDSTLSYKPDVVILLYVFNDIDYLHAITLREGLSEAPKSFIDRFQPARIAYRNSYLFQELFVRARRMSPGRQDEKIRGNDPYGDNATMERHMRDLSRFVSRAAETGARVFVIPFEIATMADTSVRLRYRRFVNQTTSAGIPTWSVEDAFEGYKYDQLTVNTLDRHPNELAHRLVAEVVASRLVGELERNFK